MSSSITKIAKAPVTFTRGYDDGAMLSLYYYVLNLFRTFHSLCPTLDLLSIAFMWNTQNTDPTGKIENVINSAWQEIADADKEAYEKGLPSPFYALPESPVIMPVNLRCNDYMDVDRLVNDVLEAVRRYCNESTEESST